MNIQDKAAETVEKLLRMTVEGKLRWERSTNTSWLARGTDDLVEVAYIADVADSRFVIYEGRYRASDLEENLYWTSGFVLKLIDEEGITLWTFPSNVSGLYDLFQAVQPQASNLESRLDKILEFNA